VLIFDKKKNAKWLSKNVEFDADFESFEKVAKTHEEKVIGKKVTETPR
jgi:hypothetical protein